MQMASHYYTLEIWKNEQLEFRSYTLHQYLNDALDEADKLIYEYFGDDVKPDRYYAGRSITPRDTLEYYKSKLGYSVLVSMMEVKHPSPKTKQLDGILLFSPK